MTDLLKNASYIKVSHSGQTPGNLFLADLADEENAKQEKKIPVYVPEGGSITLPLDEDVLLSYQQGTIRGLEDQGFLTTTLLDKPSLTATYWVGPEGDDTNPGTYSSPYASVSKAVEDVQAEFGHDVLKTVIVKPGEYLESDPIFINSKNFVLEGEGRHYTHDNSPRIDIKYDSSGKTYPLLIQTNMTRQSFDDFMSDGGVTYTFDGTTFTWTGADVTGRALAFTDTRWYQKIENVGIDSVDSDLIAGLMISSDNLSGNRGINRGCVYENVECTGALYLKNADQVEIRETTGTGGSGVIGIILDNCSSTRIFPSQNPPDQIISRFDFSNEATEGKSVFDHAFNYFTTEYYRLSGGPTYEALSLVGPDHDEVFIYQGSMYIQGVIDVQCDTVMEYDHLTCGGLIKNGAGNMVISDLLVKARNEQGGAETNGNVTISAGTSNVIEGGTIEGDLTVNAPATADLTGVIVKGNLEGDGDITMTGGGYGGANNNTGTLTYNALGTT